jgi:retron-type reverse transcriptase
MATKMVIEPMFEADFQPSSYGFRPKSSATDALEAIRVAGNQAYNFVVDADAPGYLDNIQRGILMELVKKRITGQGALRIPGMHDSQGAEHSANGMHGLKGSSMAQGRF